jgi:hypothetical protein
MRSLARSPVSIERLRIHLKLGNRTRARSTFGRSEPGTALKGRLIQRAWLCVIQPARAAYP